MAYGVTEDGFVPKTLEVLKAEMEAAEKSSNALGVNVNVAAHTVLGQINGIVSGKARELWELAEAVYGSRNPDSAVGEALDDIAAVCPGIRRDAASYSTVVATVNLDAGITLPVGYVASVSNSANLRFVTTNSVTNTGGVAADLDVAMQGEDTGPVYAAAGTLTVIETPLDGWNSITNDLAADPGEDAETNTEFRLTREATIRLAGSCHVDAIRADLLDLDDMLDAIVLENDSDYYSNSLSPHSIHTIVWDGVGSDVANNTIATTIFQNKSAGIYTHGNTVVTIEDTMGFTRDIRFDRVTQLPLYIEVDLLVDDDYAGDTEVQEAIQDMANELKIGEDVYVFRVHAAVAAVEGIVNITAVRLGWSASPSGTSDLTVPYTSIAVLQSVTVETTEV